MRWSMKASAAAAALAAALLAQPAAAAEGIVNGGFDSGTAPWTTSGGLTFGLLGGHALLGFDGNFGAFGGTLSQTFATSADGMFEYAFDMGRGEGACGCNDVGLTFEARLDGVLLSNALPTFAGSNPLSTPLLSHYSGSLQLDAGDHALTFTLTRQPTLFGRGPYFLLDSVQGVSRPDPVDPGPGVPEPTTWALMIAGFGLAGATLRRRRPALA